MPILTSRMGRLIRQQRQQRGMTQAALARDLGIRSPEFIVLVEAGRRRLDLNRLPKLSVALGLDIWELTWAALEDQHPALAQALRFQGAPLGKLASDISPRQRLLADQLDRLPSRLRRSVEELIEAIYERELEFERSGLES